MDQVLERFTIPDDFFELGKSEFSRITEFTFHRQLTPIRSINPRDRFAKAVRVQQLSAQDWIVTVCRYRNLARHFLFYPEACPLSLEATALITTKQLNELGYMYRQPGYEYRKLEEVRFWSLETRHHLPTSLWTERAINQGYIISIWGPYWARPMWSHSGGLGSAPRRSAIMLCMPV